MTAIAAFKGTMGGRNQIMAGQFGDIEVVLVVESSIVKGPILGLQPVEEGKFFFYLVDSLEDQWVAGG